MSRTLIIGDIHGCWEELQDLFDHVGLNDDDTVVSVGDLVDRGPKPLVVTDWFRTRRNSVVVCGNHERKHVRKTLSYGQHITRLQMGERYADTVEWMATLPYFWETEAIRVVHAALIPGLSLAETPPDILCGSTSGAERLEAQLGGRWWHELYNDPKPVVFGHHVVGAEALIREGRIFGLDTGACHGMRLSGLLLPTFEVVSVPARVDHWAQVRKDYQVPVLRERAWGQMTFAQLERKSRELSEEMGQEAKDYMQSLRDWSEQLRLSIPTLAQSVDAEIERLLAEHGESGFAAAAQAHLASATLFARRAGRLKTDHMGCTTPDAVLALRERLR